MLVKNLYYRPDIDGLRAFAIAAVLGFHFFPNYFPSGFIGVDVFFVISGFLITGIIIRSLEANTFSFKEFYAKRIRRLFPALLVVFGFFLFYGWLVLLPHEFEQLGLNVFSGAFSLANLYSYKHANYFDPSAETQPFLNLWSLSVEEQFYFVVPLILCLFFSIKSLKNNILYYLCFFAALSLIAGILIPMRNLSFAFFSPFTRAWEMMLGAIPVLISKKQNHYELKNFFSVLGIILVVIAVFSFNANHAYPSWRALLPTIGTVFLIISEKDGWINSKILSQPCLVFIGLISYPLYLLHYPILAFTKIINLELATMWQTKIILLLITFFFAVIIYYFVEQKIRYRKKYVTNALLLSMVVISSVSYFIYNGKIRPYVSQKIPNVYKIVNAINDWDFPGSGLEPYNFNSFEFYKIGKSKKTVLFMGDSNMQQYSHRIIKLVNDNPNHSKSAVFATMGGIPPIPNIFFPKMDIKNFDFVKSIIKFAEHKDIETIVICAAWFQYLESSTTSTPCFFEENNQNFMLSTEVGLSKAYASLEKMINKFVKNNKKVHLVLSMPCGEEYDPISFFKRDFFGNWIHAHHSCDAEAWRKRSKIINEKLKKIAARAGAAVIDPSDFLCNKNTCQCLYDNEIPIYWDKTHLRPFFVRDHVKYLDHIILK